MMSPSPEGRTANVVDPTRRCGARTFLEIAHIAVRRLTGGAFVAPLHETHTESYLADLQTGIGPDRWRVWFEDSADIAVGAESITIGVANLFISDYIQSHFAAHLADSARRALGRELPLVFRVKPELFQKRRAKNLAETAEAEERLGVIPAAAPRRAVPAPPPPQPAKPLFTLENFVVGPCNRMAFAAAQSAVAAPGKQFHPLFIHGPCGVGKTHLLQGVLNALRAKGMTRVACLSAEQFTNRYIAGMKTNSLDAFRHRYRNLDVLAIDDVHFLAGKKSTQDEFLHTFNEFDGHGRLVILASDAHPREIQSIQDQLISRWVSGLVVRLATPDTETRRRILEAKAIQMHHPVGIDILDMIADRVQGSVRDLEGVLTRIIAYAALLKQPITEDLAREVLGDMVVTRKPAMGIPEIEAEVTRFFGVTSADIRSRRKSRLISLARQVTMVLSRELTDLSFADIARLLGGKNHTTVLASCRKWHDLVKRGTQVRWTDRTDSHSMAASALLDLLKERLRR